MLPFRLSKNAHKWFRGFERGFNSEAPMFEVFYFCAMAGIAARRKTEIPTAETTELVDYFRRVPGQRPPDCRAVPFAGNSRSWYQDDRAQGIACSRG